MQIGSVLFCKFRGEVTVVSMAEDGTFVVEKGHKQWIQQRNDIGKILFFESPKRNEDLNLPISIDMKYEKDKQNDILKKYTISNKSTYYIDSFKKEVIKLELIYYYLSEQKLRLLKSKKKILDSDVIGTARNSDDYLEKQYINQQLRPINGAIEKNKLIYKEPYFGRIDLVDKNGDQDKVYIGKNAENTTQFEIFDWRSSIAKKYYMRHQMSFEEMGNRFDVLARYNFQIDNCILLNLHINTAEKDSIYDDFLLEILEKKREDYGAQDIIESIQQKQYEIVTEPNSTSIIVQGCAGSGKTMIMMHRLSYLLFNKNIKSEDTVIITPSKLFRNFFSELASTLEIDSIRQCEIEDLFVDSMNKYKKMNFGKLNKELLFSVDHKIIQSSFDWFNNFYDAKLNDLMKVWHANKILDKLSKNVLDTPKKKLNYWSQALFQIISLDENRYSKLSDRIDFYRKIFSEHNVSILSNNCFEQLSISIQNLEIEVKEIENLKSELSRIDNHIKDLFEISRVTLNSMENDERKLNELINLQSNNSGFFKGIINRRLIKKMHNDIIATEGAITLEEYKKKLEFQIIENKSKIIETNINIQNMKNINKAKEEKIIRLNRSANLLQRSRKFVRIFTENTPDLNYFVILNEYLENRNLNNKLLSTALEWLDGITYEINNSNNESLSQMLKETGYFLSDTESLILIKRSIRIVQNYQDNIIGMGIEEFSKVHKNELQNHKNVYELIANAVFEGPNLNFKYVFIDEIQDIPIHILFLLEKINKGKIVFNLFGDFNQNLSSTELINWREHINKFGLKDHYLNENYRNTIDTTKYYNEKLGFSDLPIGIKGKKVEIYPMEKFKDYICNSNENSIVIVQNMNVVNNAKQINNIPVMLVKEVKGLEYQNVYVISQGMSRNEQYVSFTRALDKLIVFENDVIVGSKEAEKYNKVHLDHRILRNYLQNKGISKLIHFTSIENLSSILDYGFVPRADHTTIGIKAIYSDIGRNKIEQRYTNFSIEYPNYRMLYNKKNTLNCKWAIVIISAELLLNDKYLIEFCKHNAAFPPIMNKLNTGQLSTLDAFNDMFADSFEYHGKHYSRRELMINDNFTTDPQAEVLVSGIIPPGYILEIHFENEEDYKYFRNQKNEHYNTIMSIDRKYFSPRIDWEHWQKS